MTMWLLRAERSSRSLQNRIMEICLDLLYKRSTKRQEEQTMSKDGLTPQQRWDQKNGYITKSFRMYKGQAEVFKKACEERGQRQAAVIKKLMDGYVDGTIKID